VLGILDTCTQACTDEAHMCMHTYIPVCAPDCGCVLGILDTCTQACTDEAHMCMHTYIPVCVRLIVVVC
jgi:hypothetical protein